MRRGAHDAANWNWAVLSDGDPARARDANHAMMALLMDIRKELRGIGQRLDCGEFLQIPYLLREIRKNTIKRKRRPKLKVVRRRAA